MAVTTKKTNVECSRLQVNVSFVFKAVSFSGDLKDETSVLAWLLDDNNRELDDAIESVNFKMLEKLLDTSPFMAVFFCEFRYHVFLYSCLLFILMALYHESEGSSCSTAVERTLYNRDVIGSFPAG